MLWLQELCQRAEIMGIFMLTLNTNCLNLQGGGAHPHFAAHCTKSPKCGIMRQHVLSQLKTTPIDEKARKIALKPCFADKFKSKHSKV